MRCKSRKRPIQKRSFLLFELMVAMGLLLLCLFPLLKTHVGIARKEIERLKELQNDQEAERQFCVIKEHLFREPYTWKELMRGVKNDEYSIKQLEYSSKQNVPEKALIAEITFQVGKKDYTRRVYIEKARHHTD